MLDAFGDLVTSVFLHFLLGTWNWGCACSMEIPDFLLYSRRPEGHGPKYWSASHSNYGLEFGFFLWRTLFRGRWWYDTDVAQLWTFSPKWCHSNWSSFMARKLWYKPHQLLNFLERWQSVFMLFQQESKKRKESHLKSRMVCGHEQTGFSPTDRLMRLYVFKVKLCLWAVTYW